MGRAYITVYIFIWTERPKRNAAIKCLFSCKHRRVDKTKIANSASAFPRVDTPIGKGFRSQRAEKRQAASLDKPRSVNILYKR